MAQCPFFGEGFGALWQVGVQMREYLQAAQLGLMNEAHNGYIDVLAQTGIIGLSLLIVFLFAALYAVLFASRGKPGTFDGWKWYAIYVTLGIILYNITESTFVSAGNYGWMLLVILFAATQLPTQSAKAIADRRARPAVALTGRLS